MDRYILEGTHDPFAVDDTGEIPAYIEPALAVYGQTEGFQRIAVLHAVDSLIIRAGEHDSRITGRAIDLARVVGITEVEGSIKQVSRRDLGQLDEDISESIAFYKENRRTQFLVSDRGDEIYRQIPPMPSSKLGK